jgi:hypothetical protein
MVSGQFGSEASREWGSYICAIRAIYCALPLFSSGTVVFPHVFFIPKGNSHETLCTL